MVYASIYGQISSFLQTLDGAGMRYRTQMANVCRRRSLMRPHALPCVRYSAWPAACYLFAATTFTACALTLRVPHARDR